MCTKRFAKADAIPLWRGSLLPLGCAAAPIPAHNPVRQTAPSALTTATQPSGSKLPRHRFTLPCPASPPPCR
ncbi:hypothetical protein F7R05_02840 [Pseudomonas koreensis]|nr:hypothetical protein F7R05_02840 [Pseudomonas koreensis]